MLFDVIADVRMMVAVRGLESFFEQEILSMEMSIESGLQSELRSALKSKREEEVVSVREVPAEVSSDSANSSDSSEERVAEETPNVTTTQGKAGRVYKTERV